MNIRATRNKTDPIEGKSVQGLYAEYDIFWSMGNNNLDAGILRVNSYIERGKWIILTDRCPNLAREAIGYKYPELTMDEVDNKNLDEKPVKAHDHGMDSIRYGFMRLPDDPDLLKTLAFEPDKRYSSNGVEFNEYGFEPHETSFSGHSGRDWTDFY